MENSIMSVGSVVYNMYSFSVTIFYMNYYVCITEEVDNAQLSTTKVDTFNKCILFENNFVLN